MSKYRLDTPFGVWLVFDIEYDSIKGINFSFSKIGFKLVGEISRIFESIFEKGEISLFDYSLINLDKTKKSYELYKYLISTRRGELISYSDLAQMVFGTPNYRRAAAMMLHNNPFVLVVPCHRVVAKKGLGGFSSGIELKKSILEWEGVDIKKGW